ncbi:hypothetical protein ASF10_23635 [Flavobacterium sp. Leaf82]|uniref:DUF4844 domain-containing protein n=1 Tax=Flavobacterium sp. Leaf82 TaxID=1736238 RepID=UPI0007002263|nr:DUF4844 domain-containing protein [Flavobacterium sp. Leaf82]KQO25828.1 hypothetical protein ASF10_23635 [Flavobacterium sp. Leaf82]
MSKKEDLIIKLLELKSGCKFERNESLFYSGISDNALKMHLNKLLNNSIDDFIFKIKNGADKIEFQKLIEKGVNQFNSFNLDTEERERICLYYEEIMDIIKLESSDGILNKWMYGFDF